MRFRFLSEVSLGDGSREGSGEEEVEVELESVDRGSAMRGSTQPSGDSGNVPSQSSKGSTDLRDEEWDEEVSGDRSSGSTQSCGRGGGPG